jgi:hypothetical protein
MKLFEFEITVKAESEQEAGEKLNAAATLMGKLTTKEIKKLADVVKNDPVKIAIAKKALGL